jgi:putative transposase
MARQAVALRGVSIALACRTFGVSETCYRYNGKLNDENEQIADLLIGLTRAKKNWALVFVFFTCAMSGDIAGTISVFTASIANWN